MELPIDHFRLLGVSPSSTTEEVLRFFRLRLDRPPEEGFTPEVLAQRSELLRRSADLLCDNQSRQKYETALLGGALGLEFSTNREVAGLILLWEADISYEAFKLARKALQPPQAPALGSGRESDLTLLAALSCRDAALQEQQERHYASSSELLEEGIQLLQRMGKLTEQRQNLETELEALLPYRILDLLSRDLSDQKSHQDGINLLDAFVLRRGGLEGKKKASNSSIELKQTDFELFFQQIRTFLTVQEQIDLFSHWFKNGSSDAGFLFAIALVASGFYRRKPEALQKARKQINRLNLQGLDSMSLLGCIDLLLADIQQAEVCFDNSSDSGLKEWLENYPGDKLAAFCDYTRNWLLRDVLPGFRDIDIETVDLEAWFADRDVQDYIEKIEKKGTLGFARAGFSFISGLSTEKDQSSPLNLEEDYQNQIPVEDDSSSLDDESSFEDDEIRFDFIQGITSRYKKLNYQFKFPLLKLSNFNFFKNNNKLLLGYLLFIGLIGSAISIGFISSKNQIEETKNIDTSIPKETKKLDSEKNVVKSDDNENASIAKRNKLNYKLLTSEKPTEQQILLLIEAWLDGKSEILSGGESLNLSKVARNILVKIVNEQREKDKALGEKQIVEAKVQSLEIKDQTNKRIEVNVKIAYKDRRVKESGELISETSIPSLTVKYILGRKKGVWQLIDFSSQS